MGVLDRLPEQAPQRIILDAERASFEQKARQIAGGSSSRYYESQNPVTFDWSGQLSTASSQAPDYGNLSLSVVMTPVKQVPLISDIIASAISRPMERTGRASTTSQAISSVPTIPMA